MALRLKNQKQWTDYLKEIGIPNDHAKKYAIKFEQEQIQHQFLKYITDDELINTYGVALAGHRLAIRHSHTESQNSVQSSSNSAKSSVRHKPPQLKTSMTPSSFRAFVAHWEVYKQLVGLSSNSAESAAQIFSLACSDNAEVRRRIADHRPDHLLLQEKEYIEMLRSLLTTRATPETYRNKLFNMSQTSTETCQDWLKRLKELVPDCEFTIPCTKDPDTFHNFDETILRTKFILGLSNPQIKQNLLNHSSILPTLDSVFNHASLIEATFRDLEEGPKAIADIYDNQSGSENEELNRISTYQKSKKRPTPKHPQNSVPCDGCGSTQHTTRDRQSKCPAWKKLCSNCNKKGHFSKVCRAPRRSSDFATAIIADISSENTRNDITVHMKVQGVLPTKQASVDFYPDTGASLCVVPLNLLSELNLDSNHLESTSRKIETATGTKIQCVGLFKSLLSLEGRATVQEIYVCKNVRRCYLSKKGCIALGLIHKDFPRPLKLPKSEISTNLNSLLPPRPTSLPFPPTVENIPRLKNYLLKVFSKTAFNDSKNTYFPKMLGVPKASIHLKADAKPYFRASPNQVPYFWREATKKLLDQHEQRGIIAKTPIGTPTPWGFPMVITPKKSNTTEPKLITVDLQRLNSQCIREVHHVEPPFKLASQVPTGTCKTLLDAVDGYQAIELDEKSRPLTTFITPWGPYHFLRVPAGLIDSGDKYTSRYDSIIQHIPRKVKCVDDALLYDHSISDAFYHTFDYLTQCSSHGIVFNASKFQFCQEEIVFAGFKITQNGIKPSDSTIQALKDFPTPKSTTDIRSWFGLVRQVAYAHAVSEDLAPMRSLLQHKGEKKPKFYWNSQLQEIFENSKQHIINSVKEGVRCFDPKRYTFLHCDWCKEGMGFLLLQKHCQCDPPDPLEKEMKPCCESGLKLIYAGSRFTTDVESRYSTTEGEATAVAWALETSRLFVLGCPKLFVITDHEPLLGILNDRDLGSVKTGRLRRIKERTFDYSFIIKHCPGKYHIGADVLSRYPTASNVNCNHFSEVCESLVASIVDYAIENISCKVDAIDSLSPVITLDKVELACVQDPDYVSLRDLVISGFPSLRKDVPDHLKSFWPLQRKNLLSTFGNIVLYQDRVVIPQSLRSYVIRILHSAHQGCTGMIARANTSVYWPGFKKDILSYQSNCRACLEISPSQPRAPLINSPIPERPFQVICADICEINGRFYLTVVDRFSGFLHMFFSKTSPTAKFIERYLRDIFTRYGRPDQLDSDGGPQFQSESFQQFLANWGIKHRLSSPYYPQSNGRAELGIKTAKRLLKENTGPDGTINNDKVSCAILQYHNTPLRDGPMSPAQLLFGRALADFLPMSPKAYQLHPFWSREVAKQQQQRYLSNRKLNNRYNVGTRELPPLCVGQSVLVQNSTSKRWNRSATVLECLQHRKYKLRMKDSGNITFRNRKFLKPVQSYILPGPSQILQTPRDIQLNNNSSEQQEFIPEDGGSNHSPPQLPQLALSPTRKMPLALRRLHPHNAPGLTE